MTSAIVAVAFRATDGYALLAIPMLLLLAVVLVAAEEALARFSLVRAESLAVEQPRRAARLARLLVEPELTRNPLRLLIIGCQALATILAALLSFRFFAWPAASVCVVFAVAVVFVAEAVPRTLAILHTERVALAVAGPVGMLIRLAPIRLVARLLIGVTNVIVPGRGLRQGPFSTPEELIALADAAVEDEVIEKTERDIIESAIEFRDTIVREVMVPRTDMTTVDRAMSVSEALEITSAAGFSRVPAVGHSVDDVVGLVYVKDLIRVELDGRADLQVEELLRPSQFVPESKKVADLLREMQRDTFHMAVAVDEYGGIAGLVTLEDLIEELVGEIVDEYDKEEPMVERLYDGTLRVDARILIDELNDLGAMNLPEGDWDTVGGLVFDVFGRVPTVGDECAVDGHRLRVERLQGRRITRVLISQLQPEPVVLEEANHER